MITLADSLMDMFISSSLVRINIEAKSDLEALQQLSDVMIGEKVVKDSFKEAVQAREKEFPTGLILEHLGVAIPHTDAIHVEKQSLAIGILKNPVKFHVMGGDENDYVDVKILFMLAIKNPKKQLEFLQALINIMQDDQQILQLLNATSETEAVETFEKIIQLGE
ncbi:PTS system, galactitol-specific IIA component [Enterococcus sp. AZ109]